MKKNYLLIFLLSLIGWSSGAWAKTAQELNAEIQSLIPQSYSAGQSFELNFRLYLPSSDQQSAKIVTLDDNLFIFHQIGKYLGITTTNSVESWATMTQDNEKKTITWTIPNETTAPNGWFSRATSSATTQQDFINNGANITISCDGTDSYVKLALPNGYTDVVKFEGRQFDLSKIRLLLDDPNGKTSSVTVGEPKQVTYKIWDATSADDENKKLLTSFTADELTNNPPRGISQIESRGYVTINASDAPTVIDANTEVINLYTTAALPFEVSTEASPIWYALKIYNNNWLWAASESSDVVGKTTSKYTTSNIEQYLWCFDGDWYNGFTIKNLKTQTYIGTEYGTANLGGDASKNNAASLGQQAAKYLYTPGTNSAWRLKVHGVDTYLAFNSSNHPNIGYWNVSDYAGSVMSVSPIYTITIKTQTAEGTQVGEGTYTYYVESGTTTIAAPKISGYATNQKTISITANQNQTVTVTYEESEFDVIARMDDFVTNGTVTATLVETTANVEHGAVYDFKNGYISGANLPQIASAYAGEDFVTVAMWVYGKPSETNNESGALFGYGKNDNGIMMKFNNGNVGMTTKYVKDIFDVRNASVNNLDAHQWNLIAFTYPGSAFTGTKEARCYVGSDADYYLSKTGNDFGGAMNVPAAADQKCAIGSGDQGVERNRSTAMIANVTVFTSADLPTNAEIYSVIGAAPILKNDPAIDFYRSIYEAVCDKNNSGRDTGKPFTAKSDVLKPLIDALSTEGGATPEHFAAIEQALANPDNYYSLPNGRYFVHNYYDFDKTDNEKNLNENQSTLTSLTSLVGTAGKVAGYWSVWDITYNESDKTYQMVNEGNKYVMRPGSVGGHNNGNYDKDHDYTDGGVLYYKPNDNSTTKYQVGTVPSDGKSALKFTPAVSLPEQSFNGVSLSDRKGYVTISGSWDVDGKTDCVMFLDGVDATKTKAHAAGNTGDHRNGDNAGDYVVKSGRVSLTKEECLWSFYRIDNNEGNAQEYRLFDDATLGSLVGAVGGVITLTNVETIECLNNIKQKITQTLDGIDKKTISNAAGERAKKYKEIIDDIESLRTDEHNKQYYQILDPNSENPFYIENISSIRPSLYSRLTTDNNNRWHTVDRANVTDATAEGRFKSEVVSGEGAQTIYRLKNTETNAKYIKTTAKSAFVEQTQTQSDAAQFKMELVIPGIYQLKQTNNMYLLISGQGEGFGLKGFDNVEISALWRFVTINTVKIKAETPYTDTDFTSPYAAANPGDVSAQKIQPVFTTFSHSLSSRVKNDKFIVPYYITNIGLKSYFQVPGDLVHKYESKADALAAHKEFVETEDNKVLEISRMYIDMTQAPRVGDYYYMEGNQGYLLVGSCFTRTITGDNGSEERLGITEKDIEFYEFVPEDETEGTHVSGYGNSIDGVNMFEPNVVSDIRITKENKTDYFALQHTYGVIGSWQSVPVHGEGLGFYNLAPGYMIGKNKAYIRAEKFKDQHIRWEGYNPNGQGAKEGFHYGDTQSGEGGNSQAVKAFLESGGGFGIRLADQKGNVTSIIEVDAKGNAQQHGIYDLQGRRVEKASKGVYIVNGQKVLFK